jgi:hypothetical protein
LERPITIIRSYRIVGKIYESLRAKISTENSITLLLKIIINVIFLIWIDDWISEVEINSKISSISH